MTGSDGRGPDRPNRSPAAAAAYPVHLDTGARALGALGAAETAAFDEHLAGCEPCRIELAEFLATAASLGVAVSQAPPAGVRARVMARVATLAQLPPVTATPGGGRRAAGRDVPEGLAAPGGSAAPSTADDAAAPSDDAAPPDDASSPDDAARPAPVIPLRRAWYRRPTALVAAAALVVALTVVGVILATRPAAQSAGATSAAMEQCVAAAPDAQMMRPTAGSEGDVMMAHSCHAAVVRVDGLPALPSGQTYQLWVMAPSGARSVGMLGSAPGPDHPMVAALQDGDSGIGVSVEPASGSDTPSSAPVWMVHLDA